jgi:hypothetical protein
MLIMSGGHAAWKSKVFTIMEANAKPNSKLSAMGRTHGMRPDFQVNFFYRENFVYLYDELFTPGKMSS